MKRNFSKKKAVMVLLFVLGTYNVNLFAQLSFTGGSGTETDPYQITNRAGLEAISNDLTAHYILMDDINLAGSWWNPIGEDAADAQFKGVLDGNGKKISNIMINSTREWGTGFFGYMVGATVKNLWLNNVNVTGKAFNGAIAGFMYQCNISNCTVSGGAISGVSDVGGIVGYVRNSGDFKSIISDCRVDVIVTSNTETVGGIVGLAENTTIIQRCIFSGSVSAGARGGGILGYSGNDWDAANMYPANEISGNVIIGTTIISPSDKPGSPDHFNRIVGTWHPGTLSNNIADVGTVFQDKLAGHVVESDLNTKDGLTKTLSELQTQSTYTDLGYSFGNNQSSPWYIEEGSIPQLSYTSSVWTSIAGNHKADNGVKVYFDRTQNQVFIRFIDNPSKSVTVSLYGITGDLIYQSEVAVNEKDCTLPVPNLTNGIYIIKVQTDVSVSHSERIIK